MGNRQEGSCVTCGGLTTDRRTYPGCQKTLFLHVFCGVEDHAKVIWCRPCAADSRSKSPSVHNAEPSYDKNPTLNTRKKPNERKHPEGPCATCRRVTRNRIICPGCRNPLFIHDACGVPDDNNKLWCRPCGTARRSTISSITPTFFTTIAATCLPFKSNTKKSQSLITFQTTTKRSCFPTHPPNPTQLLRLLLLISRRRDYRNHHPERRKG